MRIRLNEKFRPYSHIPGTRCVLPGTDDFFRVFPTHLQVFKEESLVVEYSLPIAGPIHDFTVQVDLERGWIKVWGTSKEGYFRYRIVKTKASWGVRIEKNPVPSLFPDEIVLEDDVAIDPSKERLFLGCQKAQDWEGIKKRREATEILPFMFQLGKWYKQDETASGGTAELLNELNTVHKVDWVDSFRSFFMAGFEGILSPRLLDTEYQGFHLSQKILGNPIALIRQSEKVIRDLFLSQTQDKWNILPKLPPEFHCGKLINTRLNAHTLDLEWTKKSLRRMIIRSGNTEVLPLNFPKEIRKFRLKNQQSKWVKAGSPIEVEEGEVYYLDRFEA